MASPALRWVILGAPGVGKGTYASRLARLFGLTHVNLGEYLRSAKLEGRIAEAASVRSLLQHGDLLPDELVQRLLGQLLEELEQQAPVHRGWLLDGFPRTEAQARWLDGVTSVSGALLLTLPREVLVAKLAGRRVCPDCGRTFNFMYIQQAKMDMPPLLPEGCRWAPSGLSVAINANAPTNTPPCTCPRAKDDGTPTQCDALRATCERGEACSGRLSCRDDDRIEVVRHRLAVYDRIGAPVEHYYALTGRLHRFPLTSGVASMMPALEAFFRERAVDSTKTPLGGHFERREEQEGQ